MPNLTDSGTLVRLAYRGLLNLGVDADAVLRQSGLDPAMLYKANLRTQFSAQPRFWEAALAHSGDPSIGLHLGEKMPVYKGQIFEYLLLSSPTFGAGLRRMSNYQRLISDALQGQLSENPSPCITSRFSAPKYATSHLAEAMVIGLVRLFQSVTDGTFQASKITFNHAPNAAMSEYQRIFNCPVAFNEPAFKLYFDKSLLSYRSMHAQPELFNLQIMAADQHLAKLQQLDLVRALREALASALEARECTLDKIASQLGMAPRQLRYELQSAGTSFQNEINNYRRALAKRLLANSETSISEVVYLTGFSEPSTFYRAFKRWEGLTPIEYRLQQSIKK